MQDSTPPLVPTISADTLPPPLPSPVSVDDPSASPHAEVLEELQRLQTSQRSWKAAVLILLVSLVLFVGAGSTFWDLEFVLLLIPILLFHELGHYLAMRVFGYRNLRMLFLPLLGAAVTGQNFNVAGWKKAIVSLMGPVPGIAVAILIGAAGVILEQDLLIKAALLTLIVNAFNLLPVLPLDGGWVMHALLFSRHWMLDVIFRAVAAAALILVGAWLDRIFLFLGIFMLIGVPLAYKLGRIAEQVRRQGLPPASPDDQNIPISTAEAIIDKVKAAFPMGQSNKNIAQHTLHVFETINARPPGWAATIGLGGVWGMSLVISLIFGTLFIIAQTGSLLGFLRAAAYAPEHPLAAESIVVWRGAESTANSPRHCIVAAFDSDRSAADAYADFTARLPVHAAAGLIGRHFLIAFPADDEDARRYWFGQLEAISDEVFVDGAGMSTALSLTCVARNESAALVLNDAINNYLSLPHEMHLLPPWTPHDPRTDEQRRSHDLARQTYLKLQSANLMAYDATDYELFFERIDRARRSGERTELERLRTEQQDAYRQAIRDSLQRILDEEQGPVDHVMAQKYIERTADVDDEQRYEQEFLMALSAEFGPMMGQVEMTDDGQPAPGAEALSTRWGMVSQEGLIINFYWLTFVDVLEGAPALIQWLDEQGCVGFRYEIHPQPSFDELDLDFMDW